MSRHIPCHTLEMPQSPAETPPPPTPDPERPSTLERETLLRTPTTMAPEDFHLPLKKNLLKRRVALALMVFLVIPASLSMALFFLGSDGHYPLDGFPRNQSGVGFWA